MKDKKPSKKEVRRIARRAEAMQQRVADRRAITVLQDRCSELAHIINESNAAGNRVDKNIEVNAKETINRVHQELSERIDAYATMGQQMVDGLEKIRELVSDAANREATEDRELKEQYANFAYSIGEQQTALSIKATEIAETVQHNALDIDLLRGRVTALEHSRDLSHRVASQNAEFARNQYLSYTNRIDKLASDVDFLNDLVARNGDTITNALLGLKVQLAAIVSDVNSIRARLTEDAAVEDYVDEEDELDVIEEERAALANEEANATDFFDEERAAIYVLASHALSTHGEMTVIERAAADFLMRNTASGDAEHYLKLLNTLGLNENEAMTYIEVSADEGGVAVSISDSTEDLSTAGETDDLIGFSGVIIGAGPLTAENSDDESIAVDALLSAAIVDGEID